MVLFPMRHLARQSLQPMMSEYILFCTYTCLQPKKAWLAPMAPTAGSNTFAPLLGARCSWLYASALKSATDSACGAHWNVSSRLIRRGRQLDV